MKKILLVLAALIGLLAVAVAGLMAFGTARLNARVELAPETLAVAADGGLITEGERLVQIYQCTECHGDNLGGTDFIVSDAFMNLPASNLTRGKGGLAGQLSVAEWEHAIRHGVGHDGRQLIIMPAQTFASLTDTDVLAIIAYLEHEPPVDTQLVARRFGPIGRLVGALKADDLLAARQIDHSATHKVSLDTTDTIAVGHYLTRSCTLCHGQNFAGGPLDFAPEIVASNLTQDVATGLAAWSLADFTRVLREGVRPDGTSVDATNMPWRGYSRFTDEEIEAIWGYLRSLPPMSLPPG